VKKQYIILYILGTIMTGLFFALVAHGTSNIIANKDKGLIQCSMSFFFIVSLCDIVKEILKDGEQ